MPAGSIISKYNPRYVAYARAHGHPPDVMLLVDRERHGESMHAFIMWIRGKWAEYLPDYQTRHLTDDDHTNFTAWLQNNH